jgi:hypothetical protein
MQLLKIIITLLVLIVLGILVGSNLVPMMSVMILNQPTLALPIGVWLAISIGLGLFSSSLIQILLLLERRRSHRKIRQLQQRLQQQDEDIFYTASTSESPKEPQDISDPPFKKKRLFNSYRFPFKKSAPSTSANNPARVEDDDWDAQPVVRNQREWEDEAITSPQQVIIPDDRIDRDFKSKTVDRFPESIRRSEVYDAEFRLIQPPYIEADLDELDDEEIEDYESDRRNFDRNVDEPISNNYYSRSSLNDTPSSSNVEEDEDWGFDFEDKDPPLKNSQRRDRKF